MSELTAAQILAQLQQEADAYVEETGIDQNIATQGGGGGRLLPEGYAMARLVQYIELGEQAQAAFKGKDKAPVLEYILGFALYGEGYQNDDGTPYLKRTFSIRSYGNDKAGSFKLFKKLNYEGTAKHFAQLVGKAFLVAIKHVPKKKDGVVVPGEFYDNIDEDNILAPFDPVTKAAYPIPEARVEDLLLFLFQKPTQAAWDKMHIAGENDAGKSKNWLQEKILKATNFSGSGLEHLFCGVVMPSLQAQGVPAIPAIPTVAGAATTAPAAPAMPASPKVPTVPSVPSVPAMPALPALPSV